MDDFEWAPYPWSYTALTQNLADSGTIYDTSADSYAGNTNVAASLIIADARAHWIWTQNFGTRQDAQNTDMRIYCRAFIPETCVHSLECDILGGVLIDGAHCLR